MAIHPVFWYKKKRKDWDYPQGMFVSWASDSAWIKMGGGGEGGRIPQSLSSELRHSVCVYHFLRAEGHCETTLSLSKVVCASLGLLQHFRFFTLMNWSHPPRRRSFLPLLWWRRLSLVFSWLRVIHLVKVQCATLWHKKIIVKIMSIPRNMGKIRNPWHFVFHYYAN